MKRILTWFVLVVGLLLIAGGIQRSFALSLFDTRRDWQFIESVGGMAIGTPHRDVRRHVILPIRCSLAGEDVTRHPTTGYSGLAFDTPVVRVTSTNVFLTFRTKLPGTRDAQCPPADLGRIARGDYAVFYRSPDGSREPLGKIQVP